MADIVLSLDQARDSLSKTVEGLRAESAALAAIRANAGGNMQTLMENIGPIMAKVQYAVIPAFGYSGSVHVPLTERGTCASRMPALKSCVSRVCSSR